jgi:hypothetical protein
MRAEKEKEKEKTRKQEREREIAHSTCTFYHHADLKYTKITPLEHDTCRCNIVLKHIYIFIYLYNSFVRLQSSEVCTGVYLV